MSFFNGSHPANSDVLRRFVEASVPDRSLSIVRGRDGWLKPWTVRRGIVSGVKSDRARRIRAIRSKHSLWARGRADRPPSEREALGLASFNDTARRPGGYYGTARATTYPGNGSQIPVVTLGGQGGFGSK
jgi:hypothetical protein